MGFLDRLLGRSPEPTIRPNTLRPPRAVEPPDSDRDAIALERYRYLLRTAPPGELEKAHVEAFERLTPEQRGRVRQDLESAVPSGEAPASSDPQDLARAATRAEVRAPGTLERAFGGSFLHTFAAVFVATSMAEMLFGGFGDPYATDPGSDVGADGGDFGSDSGDIGGFGDFGGFDI
ncbi:hypothetical protein BH23CHL8_BH23CHL8_07750 [soil metagenome]